MSCPLLGSPGCKTIGDVSGQKQMSVGQSRLLLKIECPYSVSSRFHKLSSLLAKTKYLLHTLHFKLSNSNAILFLYVQYWKQQISDLNQWNQVTKNVDLPSISISLLSDDVKTDFKYYCIPSLSENVFFRTFYIQQQIIYLA